MLEEQFHSSGSDEFLARGDFVYRDGPPVMIARAKGASLYSDNDARWIDLGAGNGATLFGYEPEIIRRVAETWSTLPFCSASYETTHRLRYAQELGTTLFNHLNAPGKLSFATGGSGGIELALRIATASRPSRRSIVVLQGCYHGRSLLASHLSSSVRYRQGFPSPGYHIVRIPIPPLFAQQTGCSSSEALRFCTAQMRSVLRSESNGVSHGDESDAIAVLFEPLLNVAGLVDPCAQFLNDLLAESRNVGAITIADEVFTGCYRTGPFLACSELAYCPDIIVLCKALTNGLTPMSAIWSRQDLADLSHFPPGSYSSTHCNAPINFILGSEILRMMNSVTPDQITRVTEFLEHLCAQLRNNKTINVSDIGVRGLTSYISFRTTADRDQVRRLLAGTGSDGDTGVLFASTSLSPNRMLVHPALTILDEEMEAVFRCMRRL